MPTPARAVNVPAGKRKIHLELEGYLPLDYEIEVKAGQNIIDRQPLTPAPARVKVTTEPAGAQVTLGGRVLGTTPLERDDLRAENGVTVTLSRAGYEPISVRVDLEPGKLLSIDRTLKAAQKFAVVRLHRPANTMWGEAYLNGKRVGRAPSPTPIKLPVGRVKLHLINPPSKTEWDASCDVVEGEDGVCLITGP
jgi:hypothetical protein